jgi:DMSO/TMAO reductase YedYZ heme-binding membrane subunit
MSEGKKSRLRDLCMILAGICFFLAGLTKTFVVNAYNVFMMVLGIFAIVFFSFSFYKENK